MKVLHLFGIMLLFSANFCFAKTIVITGQKVINKPTAYRNVTLDLSQGSFLIINNAILELNNTVVNGTISETNHSLIREESGKLVLKNNQFNITVGDFPTDRNRPALYNALKIAQGMVYIVGNKFTVDKNFSVGLLSTEHFETSGFVIRNNTIDNFHGGFFLTNSNNALIAGNTFTHVSLSNIFTKEGNNNLYQQNTILFSGNNGMDVIDSSNITLRQNYISLSSCYSIFILRSQDVTIDSNQIIGGITYAIYVAPSIGLSGVYDQQLTSLVDTNSLNTSTYKSSNLSITHNYFGQNRYGLTTISVDGLTVRDNIFIQRFADSLHRKFWTNNDVLLQETINISWKNNYYKEAFTQLPSGSNENASRLISFPMHGGVAIES